MPSEPPKKSARAFTTLLAEHLGKDYAEFGDGHGKVRIWHLGHRISVFESSGNLKIEHAQFIIAWHAKHIEAYERPFYAFGNWSHLDAYTPDVRKSLTDWQVKMKYDELHVSHDSKMLAMGISIANAVLPTTVQVHPTEEALDDVLNGVRKRHGL